MGSHDYCDFSVSNDIGMLMIAEVVVIVVSVVCVVLSISVLFV